MTDEDLRLLDEWRHDCISEEDFEVMQARLREEPKLRAELRALADIEEGLSALAVKPLAVSIPVSMASRATSSPIWLPWTVAAAAGVMALFGWLPQDSDSWHEPIVGTMNSETVDWKGFSLAGGETQTSTEPDADSTELNRVTGSSMSSIDESNANGVLAQFGNGEARGGVTLYGSANSTEMSNELNYDSPNSLSLFAAADFGMEADSGVKSQIKNGGSGNIEITTGWGEIAMNLSAMQSFEREAIVLDENIEVSSSRLVDSDTDLEMTEIIKPTIQRVAPTAQQMPALTASEFSDVAMPEVDSSSLSPILGKSAEQAPVPLGGPAAADLDAIALDDNSPTFNSGQNNSLTVGRRNWAMIGHGGWDSDGDDLIGIGALGYWWDKDKGQHVVSPDKSGANRQSNELLGEHRRVGGLEMSSTDSLDVKKATEGSDDSKSEGDVVVDQFGTEYLPEPLSSYAAYDSAIAIDGAPMEISEGWELSTRYAIELNDLDEKGGQASRSKQVSSLFNTPRVRVVPVLFPEIQTANEPFSTFSLNVSDVSFKLAQASLADGQWPESAKIRIEEFINAFDYSDPMPSSEERVACRHEQAIHPFLTSRNLLRISMRTAEAGRSSQTPLRLTLLLDYSGSMDRADRRESVQRAFALLAQQLLPNDQVTLIGFARQPRLLADRIRGAEAGNLLANIVANTASDGGTNLEAALKLAMDKALEQKLDGAQNRIVLLTDGAANLGDAEPKRLVGLVETMRLNGIAFDAAGVGADGFNDEMLETLTRKGDGRYYFLDRPEDADDGFAKQIAGALRPAAMNVKVQVEFNPKRVGRYKLLGYEKHRLQTEDFRNDSVDAAELAAAEAGVALYPLRAASSGRRRRRHGLR